MLQHLHTGHHVILSGMFCRVLFHGFLARNPPECRFPVRAVLPPAMAQSHIQTGHRRALPRHTLGQNAAATTDIEHLLPINRQHARQYSQTQRVNAVQRFELTFKIPPAGGDGFKFSDLFVVYVVVYRRFSAFIGTSTP